MRRRQRDSELYNFWPAFTDGMTGLFLAIIVLFVTLTVQNFLNVMRLMELEEMIGRIDREVLQPLRGPDSKSDRGSLQLGEAVLFDFDSAVLRPAGKPKLAEIGNRLKTVLDRFDKTANTNLQISIEGHTDSKGTPAYNLNLSTKRAQAVAEFWERSCGLTRQRYDVVAIGRGPFRPLIASPGTERQHAINRRIEIRVYPRFDALMDVLMRDRMAAAQPAPVESAPPAPPKAVSADVGEADRLLGMGFVRHADAFLKKGDKGSARKNYLQAKQHFRNAVSKSPSNPEPHFNLGVSLDMLGEDQAAREEFKSVVKLAKPEHKALKQRALYLLSRYSSKKR